MIKNIILSMNF